MDRRILDRWINIDTGWRYLLVGSDGLMYRWLLDSTVDKNPTN